MDTPALKLVRSTDSSATRRKERFVSLSLGLLAVASAVLATLSGADRAREKFDPVETGREVFVQILERGSDDPEIRAAIVDLRRRIGERPLDTKTRAIYAWLLLETSGAGQADAACFHAARAADLNPVTVPVVRAAAHVLFRCGERSHALALTRDMFIYDPDAAARQVAHLEPFLTSPLTPDETLGAIPGDPDAYLSWARELRKAGRGGEAREWLESSHERWPTHVATLRVLARDAIDRRDWDEVERLLPLDGDLPVDTRAAHLYALRGRLRAETGDPDGAVQDVEKALEISGGGVSVLVAAGEALSSARRPAEARRLWHRALFDLNGDGTDSTRRGILVRIARLEDAHGRPADALRAWKAVLEQDPDHTQARRRTEELTGVPR